MTRSSVLPLLLASVMARSSLNRFTSYLYLWHQLWRGHHWTDLPVTFTSSISYGEVIVEQIYQLPLLLASVMARSSVLPLLLASVMARSSLNRFASYLYFWHQLWQCHQCYLYFWHQLWRGHHWTDLPVTFFSGISYGEVIIEQIYQLPLLLASVMATSSLNRFTSYLYLWHQLWRGHHWTDLLVTFTSGISYGEVIVEQIYQLPLLLASVMARSSLNRFTSYLYF